MLNVIKIIGLILVSVVVVAMALFLAVVGIISILLCRYDDDDVWDY